MVVAAAAAGTMRGQAEEDANGLYQEAIKLHNEDLCPVSSKFEAVVLELVQAKNRQDISSIGNVGRLKVLLMLF